MANLVWLLVPLQLAQVTSAVLSQGDYVGLRVPDGYFVPAASQNGAHSTRADCAFACTVSDACEAFAFVQDKCTLGDLDVSKTHIPSYVRKGTDVMVKSSRVEFDAHREPHIAHAGMDAANTWDSAVNASHFDPVDMPRVPEQKLGVQLFDIVNYKGGLIACGGMTGTTVVKKCWYWTFPSGRWRQMEGELAEGHYNGELVVVGDYLWMFMGRPTPTGTAHKKVESYNLQGGLVWSQESDADVQYGVSHFGAVVFDNTKVLLVGGKRSTLQSYSPRTYVFDSISGTYTQKGDLHAPLGYSHMGCTMKPMDAGIILCVGGQDTVYKAEARHFSVATEEWEIADDALDSLPEPTRLQLFPLDGEVFVLTQVPRQALRYTGGGGGGDSAWEVLDGVDTTYHRDVQNFAYTLSYHRLL